MKYIAVAAVAVVCAIIVLGWPHRHHHAPVAPKVACSARVDHDHDCASEPDND